ncbi:phosphotransferase-like protein [Paraburkholderia bannensis]|uniref:phosphotransferase-like protein n=1 Tax=Paraburkholderia bannensis TaxID=765414 RepID=UPI002AAF1F29|nr:AAA family ATPase [Paraburkholderia bannensis]
MPTNTPTGRPEQNGQPVHDGQIIVLSGPPGSGKTSVARALVPLLPQPVAWIEGDRFWKFIVKPDARERHENFRILIRSMTAACLPFARSGFHVVLDFSVPPAMLDTLRTIVKDIPLHYVLLRPSVETCALRASGRDAGKIADYETLRGFYTLFTGEGASDALSDDSAAPTTLAAEIVSGLAAGRFKR